MFTLYVLGGVVVTATMQLAKPVFLTRIEPLSPEISSGIVWALLMELDILPLSKSRTLLPIQKLLTVTFGGGPL